MAAYSERDARRYAAFERLAKDASAAPNEREQARQRAEALRARYGGAPAEERPRTHRPWWENRYRAYTAWADWGAGPDYYRTTAEEARRQQEQAERARRVKAQREQVERVPRWRTSAILRELHAASSPWDAESERLFKEQRVRLTGSSRAVDL